MVAILGKFYLVWSPCSYVIFLITQSCSKYLGKDYQPFKHQSYKMVKHTQTIRLQIACMFSSVFAYFVKFALKGLRNQAKMD